MELLRTLGVGLVAIVIGACGFDQSGVVFNDGGVVVRPDARLGDARVSDARVTGPDAIVTDASPTAPDAQGCAWPYTPVFFDPCAAGTPVASPGLLLDLNGTYVYNSDDATLTDPNMVVTSPASSIVAGARAVWFNDIVINSDATLRLEGSLPVILISLADLNVQGTIEVNSHVDGLGFVTGAGANYSGCSVTPPDPGAVCAQHGGSGGGAGAFSGNGGAGGEGGDTRSCGGAFPDGVPGGAGGVGTGATPPVNLRGGCAGRDGSQNNSGSGSEGGGGPGGGAVHLAARGTLTLAGTLHAGGSGGGAGQDDRSGGGGGGSGGTLSLEGLTLDIKASATLAANGGGGGGGCDNNPAAAGQDGQPSDQLASGGPKQGAGGDGGAGGAAGTPNGGTTSPAQRGGGGGGGGVGFILLYSPNTPMVDGSATFSPPSITQ